MYEQFFSTDFFLSHVSFFVDSLNLYWTTHEHCKRKDTYQNLDLQIEAFHNNQTNGLRENLQEYKFD